MFEALQDRAAATRADPDHAVGKSAGHLRGQVPAVEGVPA
jgi:hypothetical protein